MSRPAPKDEQDAPKAAGLADITSYRDPRAPNGDVKHAVAHPT